MNTQHRWSATHSAGPPLARRAVASLLLMAMATLVACGSDQGAEEAARARPTEVAIAADDYSFDAPDRIRGGLVELTFTNNGKEPHFAGLAKVLAGKTFEEVEASLAASPSGPPPSERPPYEEVAGLATIDPGRTANLTVNLAPGTYALFCLIPAPDGATHAHKGMVRRLTVTDGSPVALPESVGTVTATDFALTELPGLQPGTNTVRLRNQGKQLHEMNLVELAPGRTVDEVVRWYRSPTGPPPMTSLGGAAVKPGEEGVSTLELRSGRTYAFICVIPDVLGDFVPHLFKGMYTPAFTVK
jgi:uncharacterized cupredoxin-like copper-binding protein